MKFILWFLKKQTKKLNYTIITIIKNEKLFDYYYNNDSFNINENLKI